VGVAAKTTPSAKRAVGGVCPAPSRIEVNGPPSTRLLRACAGFGLAVRVREGGRRAAHGTNMCVVRDVLAHLGNGGVALVTGPSGCGKTSLLRALADELEARGSPWMRAGPALHGADHGASVIDLVGGTLPKALHALAGAGLADAMILGRSAGELSDGERFRLGLARAMSGLSPGTETTTLVIDEFASTLDRATARCVCLALRRWLATAARAGISFRLVCATAHDDVVEWLRPDQLILCPSPGRAEQVLLHEGAPTDA